MAEVVITNSLKLKVYKKFKEKSLEIFNLMKSLENTPHKGKNLGSVGGIVIKELKYDTFRFYFITDGHRLKFGTEDELASLIIKFVRISKKKDQQKTINEIKNLLKSLGFDSF